jgi:DNA-binding response OmpR family regulator
MSGTRPALDGRRILIVEDEAMLALDLSFAMQDLGAVVVGPVSRLRPALDLAGRDPPDAAVLDVDLAGEAVFPLADRLLAEGVPILFHTGHHDPHELARRYAGARVCPKPTDAERVALAVCDLLARRPDA